MTLGETGDMTPRRSVNEVIASGTADSSKLIALMGSSLYQKVDGPMKEYVTPCF